MHHTTLPALVFCALISWNPFMPSKAFSARPGVHSAVASRKLSNVPLHIGPSPSVTSGVSSGTPGPSASRAAAANAAGGAVGDSASIASGVTDDTLSGASSLTDSSVSSAGVDPRDPRFFREPVFSKSQAGRLEKAFYERTTKALEREEVAKLLQEAGQRGRHAVSRLRKKTAAGGVRGKDPVFSARADVEGFLAPAPLDTPTALFSRIEEDLIQDIFSAIEGHIITREEALRRAGEWVNMGYVRRKGRHLQGLHGMIVGEVLVSGLRNAVDHNPGASGYWGRTGRTMRRLVGVKHGHGTIKSGGLRIRELKLGKSKRKYLFGIGHMRYPWFFKRETGPLADVRLGKGTIHVSWFRRKKAPSSHAGELIDWGPSSIDALLGVQPFHNYNIGEELAQELFRVMENPSQSRTLMMAVAENARDRVGTISRKTTHNSWDEKNAAKSMVITKNTPDKKRARYTEERALAVDDPTAVDDLLEGEVARLERRVTPDQIPGEIEENSSMRRKVWRAMRGYTGYTRKDEQGRYIGAMGDVIFDFEDGGRKLQGKRGKYYGYDPAELDDLDTEAWHAAVALSDDLDYRGELYTYYVDGRPIYGNGERLFSHDGKSYYSPASRAWVSESADGSFSYDFDDTVLPQLPRGERMKYDYTPSHAKRDALEASATRRDLADQVSRGGDVTEGAKLFAEAQNLQNRPRYHLGHAEKTLVMDRDGIHVLRLELRKRSRTGANEPPGGLLAASGVDPGLSVTSTLEVTKAPYIIGYGPEKRSVTLYHLNRWGISLDAESGDVFYAAYFDQAGTLARMKHLPGLPKELGQGMPSNHTVWTPIPDTRFYVADVSTKAVPASPGVRAKGAQQKRFLAVETGVPGEFKYYDVSYADAHGLRHPTKITYSNGRRWAEHYNLGIRYARSDSGAVSRVQMLDLTAPVVQADGGLVSQPRFVNIGKMQKVPDQLKLRQHWVRLADTEHAWIQINPADQRVYLKVWGHFSDDYYMLGRYTGDLRNNTYAASLGREAHTSAWAYSPMVATYSAVRNFDSAAGIGDIKRVDATGWGFSVTPVDDTIRGARASNLVERVRLPDGRLIEVDQAALNAAEVRIDLSTNTMKSIDDYTAAGEPVPAIANSADSTTVLKDISSPVFFQNIGPNGESIAIFVFDSPRGIGTDSFGRRFYAKCLPNPIVHSMKSCYIYDFEKLYDEVLASTPPAGPPPPGGPPVGPPPPGGLGLSPAIIPGPVVTNGRITLQTGDAASAAASPLFAELGVARDRISFKARNAAGSAFPIIPGTAIRSGPDGVQSGYTRLGPGDIFPDTGYRQLYDTFAEYSYRVDPPATVADPYHLYIRHEDAITREISYYLRELVEGRDFGT